MKEIVIILTIVLTGVCTMNAQRAPEASLFQERQFQLRSSFLKFNPNEVVSPKILNEDEGIPAGVLIIGGLALSAVPFITENPGVGTSVLSGLGGTLLVYGIIVALSNSSE